MDLPLALLIFGGLTIAGYCFAPQLIELLEKHWIYK